MAPQPPKRAGERAPARTVFQVKPKGTRIQTITLQPLLFCQYWDVGHGEKQWLVASRRKTFFCEKGTARPVCFFVRKDFGSLKDLSPHASQGQNRGCLLSVGDGYKALLARVTPRILS